MPLGLADQLFQVGFALVVGAAGGALFWRPRALAGEDGSTVLDDRLGEPWATRLLRGLALLAILLAAVLIHLAASA